MTCPTESDLVLRENLDTWLDEPAGVEAARAALEVATGFVWREEYLERINASTP